jgi:hypothetical protein
MKMRVLALSLLLLGCSGAAYAGGTKEQEDACKPDVRKFCYKLPPNSSDGEYLSCLQANRPRLSKACRQMLESNGV